MKHLLSILLISFIFCETRDIIYLKNGSIIKGVVIEQVINDYIKIESGDNLFVYKFDEVLRIEKENINFSSKSVFESVSNIDKYKDRFDKAKTGFFTSWTLAGVYGEWVIKSEYDNYLILPLVGPFLQIDRVVEPVNYSNDSEKVRDKILLIIVAGVQIGYFVDMLVNRSRIIKEESKYSFNIIPYPENPTLNLSFKF